MSELKSYIVTLKDHCTDLDVSLVKEKVSTLGGSVVSEFSLIKGFTAKLPAVHSESLGGHDLVNTIEEDKEVHTQS